MVCSITPYWKIIQKFQNRLSGVSNKCRDGYYSIQHYPQVTLMFDSIRHDLFGISITRGFKSGRKKNAKKHKL